MRPPEEQLGGYYLTDAAGQAGGAGGIPGEEEAPAGGDWVPRAGAGGLLCHLNKIC
jgi:hypothetical protein